MKSALAVCLFARLLSGQTTPTTSQAPQAAAAPQAAPTGSMEGQVFNLATGAPLKRASVTLRMTGNGGRGRGAFAGPNQQMRETDDTGHFVFTNLDTGKYMLSAERQGYLRANYGGRKYNTSGTPIVLGKDQHLTQLVLRLNPQSVVVGKVLDEDGDPVANVNVRAYKLGYRNGKKQWVQAGSGSTSDIGEYRIPQLDPGRYLVATSQIRARMGPPGQPSSAPLPDAPDVRYAATYYPSTTQEANAAPVDVQPGAETRGIDIRLVKTQVYRVRGRIVMPAEGRNLPMVMLVPKDGTRGASGESPARPPDYRFEITGVSPGSYFLYGMTGGRGGGQESLAFQAVEIQNRHLDNVVLSPTPGADVQGTVKVDEAHGGTVDLTKITVVLRPTVGLGRPARGKAEANGAFVLSGVVPLKYTLDVSGLPDGCYLKSVYYGGREVSGEDGFDIVGGGTIDITVGADAGSASASVIDKDGNPVNSASVALVSKEGVTVSARTTDENGATSFSGLKPGEYTLIAWDDMPPGAYWDPDFVKKYSGAPVKIEPRGTAAVQVKAVAVE
jgi:uncharacterized surface anchored protein